MPRPVGADKSVVFPRCLPAFLCDLYFIVKEGRRDPPLPPAPNRKEIQLNLTL